MYQRHPLDYARPPRPTSRRSVDPAALLLAVLVIVLPIVGYVLFELQRAPYRPPEDMGSLLSASEIEIVRWVIGVLSVFWLLCVGLLALRWREGTGTG